MITTIIQSGKNQGMQLMDDALMGFVEEKRITAQEAFMKAMNKSRFEALVKEEGGEAPAAAGRLSRRLSWSSQTALGSGRTANTSSARRASISDSRTRHYGKRLADSVEDLRTQPCSPPSSARHDRGGLPRPPHADCAPPSPASELRGHIEIQAHRPFSFWAQASQDRDAGRGSRRTRILAVSKTIKEPLSRSSPIACKLAS